MRKRLLLFVVAALVWSVSARVNAQERISLQKVEFSIYDGWGVDAKKTGTITPAWLMGVPSNCPYGDSYVNNGADLSAFSKMYVTVSPESEGLRIMMNRKVQEGQCADTEEASNLISIPSHAWCTQKYCTIEGNTYIIDLAQILKDQGFVRLHAIKGASINTTATIESIELELAVNFTEEELEFILESKRQELLAYADSIGELGYTALKDELQTLIGDGSSVENTLEAKRAEYVRLNCMNTFGKEVFGLSQLVADGESLIAQKKLVSLSEAIAAAKTVVENKTTATSDNFVKAYGELTTACQTWHVRFDDINQWYLNYMVRIDDFDVYLDMNSKMASIYRYYGKSAKLEIPETLSYNGEDYSVVGVGGRVNDYNYQAICDSLVSVKLPETLRFIGRYAFNGNTALDSLVVPEYVTWIGQSAFSGTSLNELHVKATVPPVCEGDLSPIYIVYVPEGCGNAYWDSDYWKDCAIVPGAGINLFITLQEPGTLGELILQQTEYLRNVNSLKIAGNVNETDMQIIGRLQGLISVDMSELTITSLPGRLFEGRKALTSVKLPATLESIGQYAFSECAHLYSIELPETLKSIEWYAFNNSSIASIDLPEGLNYLGQHAFQNCDNLEEITIPSGVKTIESSTFSSCYRLKKVVCHEGLERINNGAFGYCQQLESVTLPSTLKQCDHAFDYCNNMKQIICYAM